MKSINIKNIRLLEIHLEGFKNTEYGSITMPSAHCKDFFSKKFDLVGIYGQNGTGKTAIVDALYFIQMLLSGESLPSDAENYISKKMQYSTIRIMFSIETNESKVKAEYGVTLQKHDKQNTENLNEQSLIDGQSIIKEEFLLVSEMIDGNFCPKKTLIMIKSDEPNSFYPQKHYTSFTKRNSKLKYSIGIAIAIALRSQKSALFNSDSLKFFTRSFSLMQKDYSYIFKALHTYAIQNLFVISNTHPGVMNINSEMPPICYSEHEEISFKASRGNIGISVDGPCIVSLEFYDILSHIIPQINLVLSSIVPEIELVLKDLGKETLSDGKNGIRFQLMSKREEVLIPTKYESSGIKKIISLLNVLIHVFNNNSSCLVIDEIDAGIFEYLLGELLKTFEDNAKGQLLFTSHNLRPLELLDKNSIVFSTSNPKKRYVRIKKVKKNANLREVYYRIIQLGGETEQLYMETEQVKIARAFRKASKVALHEEK